MNFEYKGHDVQIVTQPGKKNTTQYWCVIDSRPVTWSKSQEKIERIARNYIDVLQDEEFLVKRQVWISKPIKLT